MRLLIFIGKTLQMFSGQIFIARLFSNSKTSSHFSIKLTYPLPSYWINKIYIELFSFFKIFSILLVRVRGSQISWINIWFELRCPLYTAFIPMGIVLDHCLPKSDLHLFNPYPTNTDSGLTWFHWQSLSLYYLIPCLLRGWFHAKRLGKNLTFKIVYLSLMLHLLT